MGNSSWLLEDSICNTCGYEIVVTQGTTKDYRYYCSNLECKNHTIVEELYDDEDCSFALYNRG